HVYLGGRGQSVKVFIVAGEPSGDRLAAALMAGLRTSQESIEFSGVGGPLMQAQGLDSLFDMTELSVMGLAEILPKYRHLKRRISETARAAVAANADVMITVDSPDFCLRVARLVKAATPMPTVHYVAPSVWAWRAGRAAKMAKVIDHVLAILPFEPPLMTNAGMGCDFVGHPIVAEPAVTPDMAAQFLADHGLDAAPLAVLPGSRKGEVTRMMAVFQDVLADPRFADRTVVVPTFPHLKSVIAPFLKDAPQRIIFVDGQGLSATDAAQARQIAITAADRALAASGTISLELAKARTPMVIAYDMNWLSRQIVSRMLNVDTVTLVNLVSDTRAVPEFIGSKCRPGPIADALAALDQSSDQRTAMDVTMDRLGEHQTPPGHRAAQSVMQFLGRA
ncbi:MAG: lipid-A-disaccharide synthase, partial [Pseudomonadota bacterium]